MTPLAVRPILLSLCIVLACFGRVACAQDANGTATPSPTAVASTSPRVTVTAPGKNEPPSPATARALFNRSVWLAGLFGALGGLVFELIALVGGIEMPHRPIESVPTGAHAEAQRVVDLGVFARLIIGALAGVASLYLTTDLANVNEIKLASTALIAGSGGIAYFRTMQTKIGAADAARDSSKDATTVRDALKKQTEIVQGALNSVEKARTTAVARGPEAGDSIAGDLDGARALLQRAIGLQDAVPAPPRSVAQWG